MQNKIEINCDMGESLTSLLTGFDTKLMDYVDSVNIACGYHAGNHFIISKTIDNAILKKVNIGAHPGFDDKLNFGRIEQNISLDEIYDLMIYQIGAVKSLAESKNVKLIHVKPHGALYNLSAKNKDVANSIAKAVAKVDSELILYGLSRSFSVTEAQKIGLKTKSEVFVDRTYADDGSLLNRAIKGATKTTLDDIMTQTKEILNNKSVVSINKKVVHLDIDSICIHGDGLNALENAKCVHKILLEHYFNTF